MSTYKDLQEAPTERPAPPVRRSGRKPMDPTKRRSNLLTVMVWICVLYFIVPLLWLTISTTKDNSGLFSSFGLWFSDTFDFLANVQNLATFQDGVFWRWMINTLVYAVASAVGASLLAAASGYALAKYRFRGRSVVVAVILGSIMVPLTALALPTYLVFAAANLTDTPWAIILPSLISPFGVFLMMVYAADAVDDSLLEAARIDGSGELRTFATIGMRLLAPGFVTVLLFQLVATWNNYFLPLIMLNTPALFPGNGGPGPVAVQRLRGRRRAGPVLDGAHGRVRVDHPARHCVPVPPALLGLRARDRGREGVAARRREAQDVEFGAPSMTRRSP